MASKIIVGAQWGDEGKGKVIDILASQSDMVVRSQGGNNAGHTVVADHEEYKLHMVPSGILYKDCDCIIGSGVVIDPRELIAEMDAIKTRGVGLDRLKIDARTHVIMPYHIELDALSEGVRGDMKIGTTKKGIGPCYMDKVERSGIRMCDFTDDEEFKKKLRENLQIKNKIIVNVYGGEPLDFDKVYAEYSEYARALAPYMCDTSVLIYDAIKAGKNVTFEGAQGTLLDIDFGTYPFVTSSHPVSGGVCIGAGVGPTLIDGVLGIMKAYTTRVGLGPFPTELFDETGEFIRNRGGEFGATTGRARRTGWLDTVIVSFSVRVNGLTELAVNKLDTLSGIKTLKVCTAYEIDGKVTKHFPADLKTFSRAKPVYTELPGWDEDITGVTKYDDLPANVKSYIEFIEKECGCRVSMGGVGPDRTQNLYK
ncbi:MAG: adenylosuccinate synthase [Clostridia bacterium]|nr:adenylosuccinate synthase [Clostridia bacterium]